MASACIQRKMEDPLAMFDCYRAYLLFKKSHRNLTSAFIANEMYGLIVDNLAYEPKMIFKHIERTFKYTISYDKAWRAKQKVFEMRFGTYEASYDNLPRMLAKIVERNLESHFDVRHFPSLIGGPSVLQRVFFYLGACVRVFQYSLPVLCIDGTFLTGKYKGQILTAIGVDGNNLHSHSLRMRILE